MDNLEKQIKSRRDADTSALNDSLEGVSSVIEGKKRYFFSNDREKIKCVLDEVFLYYRIKPREIPVEIVDLPDQIDYLCRPSGLMYRHVKLDKGWYKNASGALLGKLKTGESVALIPDFFGCYVFFDPNTQKKIRINKKTQELLEEDAYAFYKPFPQRKLKIRDLVKYIVGTIPVITFIEIILLTLVSTLVGLLTPRITKIIFSTVLESKELKLLISITVLYICTAISLLLISAMKSLVMEKVSVKMDVSVQAATMARVLSLPTSFFKEYSSGEITSRAQYINSLCSTIVSTFFSTGLTSLFSLIYIGQIFIYASSLVIPALCITLATIALSLITSFAQMKISKKKAELSAKMYGTTYQIISGVQKIKLSGSEKRVFARWLNQYSEMAKLEYNPPKFLLFNGVISTTISLIGTFVMYWFAIQSQISVADYTAFNSAYGMLSGALMSVASIAMTASTIKPIIDMSKPIMNAVPENTGDKQIITSLNGKIELFHISFKYEDNAAPVIDDLSLKIEPGQYVAIVGKTGCGKSTLMRLLLGFETPQKGAVYYDDKDISTLDLQSLRRKIGAVTQNGKLFQGDIYSNIIISAPYLSVDDAWKAAEIADIKKDIEDMPMGMHTIISEGSGGISGGQKQRLMIARAVAPSPKILMFDEATSALDNITQKKVSNALDHLKCTRIVIAHRLSTIKQCDRIIVIDEGHIVEDGTYKELIAKKGFFAELVERQRLE